MMLNQLARYGPVVNLIEEIGGTTALEVGSGSRGIADYLSDRWQITATDVDFSDYGASSLVDGGRAAQVEADVLRLPFGDRAFDAVVAVDLLEHVAPGDRAVALAELARVTRRRLVVAVPCGDPALAADRRLASYYRRHGLELPVWLSEHLENGFPQRDELQRGLAPFGELRLLGNEAIWIHERVGRLEAHPRWRGLSPLLARVLAPGVTWPRAVSGRAAAFLLAALRGADRPPAYRVLAVVDRASP